MLHTLSRSHQLLISDLQLSSCGEFVSLEGLGIHTGIRGRFFIGDEVWEGKGSMLGEMHWVWGIETGRERVACRVLAGGGAEWGDERCGEFLGARVHGDAG
jgi:hypothetical protein